MEQEKENCKILENFIDYDNNIIHIYSDISESTALEISMGINKMNPELDSIHVKLNTQGGDFASCISIIRELLSSPYRIITDVVGIAFSAGAVIMLCGDERKCFKMGYIMFHSSSTNVSDRMERIEEWINTLKLADESLMTELLKNTKIDYKKFKKLSKDKDWYISPEEALKFGFINEIYEGKTDIKSND